MKILHEKESNLLDRTSFVLEMEYPKSATTPRLDVRKKVAEKFKVNENLVAIQKIKTKFGGKLLEISCNIYKDPELLKRLETSKKKEQVKETKPAEGG